MPVLLENKAIYYHIPKTGGTWVTDACEKFVPGAKAFSEFHFGIKHCTPDDLLAEWELHNAHGGVNGVPRPDTLPRVVSVRHPASWYVSMWRYAQYATKWDSPYAGHVLSPIYKCGKESDGNFHTFIDNVLDSCPGFVSGMYEAYGVYSSYIMKQERLYRDFVGMLGRYGISFYGKKIRDMGIVNGSMGEQVTWDEKRYKAICKSEGAAIKVLGYK